MMIKELFTFSHSQLFIAITIHEVKPIKGPFTILFMFRTSRGFIAQVLGNGLILV